MSRNGTANDWFLDWNAYKNGFSLGETDFWLGLERMHQLTTSDKYRLRIELLRNYAGEKWYSLEYWTVVINNEADGYRLNVDG